MTMFGYFRFFLATLVLLSHVGMNLNGFNPGVVAVVSFYMLAGYVVCKLLTKNFSAREPIYLPFYYERLLRILPNYFFVALLTLAFIAITGFGKPKLTFLSLFNNALVIPLNYYIYFDNSILTEPKWWLIPPAWSLGAELQAYLVLPLVVYFRSMKIIFSISSFVVFSLACVGILHTEHFGYRLLPGVLFIFILGVTTCNNTHREGLSDLLINIFR